MEKDITNTSTPEGPGKDTVDVLKDDPAELFEEIKSTENRNGDSERDKDNRKFVSVKNMDDSSPSESKCQEEKKDHDLGKLEANMDLESKSQEGTLSNDTQQVDQAENRYDGKNIESKLEEERKQNTVENCGDIFKHDDLGEMDASIDVESKSQQGTLSNDIEQVDQDEGENFESEHEEERKQITRENSGDIVKHDDMGEMDASAESKYQEGTLSNDIEQVEKRDEGKNSESKPEEQIKHITEENCADSIKHDDLVEVDASMDLESKFQRGNLSNDIEQVDQSEKRDEGKNFESKLEEEREQAIRENCGDSVKQNDLDENRADSIKHDNLDEVDASIDLESKSRRETLSNDIGQVDQREKRDEGKNFESKPEKGNQTTGDNFGDSIKHDDLDEMEASMDPESKSERGTLSNDIEQLEQGEKRDEGENFESKPEEERKQTNRGICGDSIEPDNLGEMVTTMDLGSKSQRSNAIQQVDQGEKRDEGKSKPQEERSQTVGENFADSIRHDDLSEMDANMDLEAKFHRGTLSNDIEQVDQGETAGETCGHSIKHDDLGDMEASMDLGSKYQRGFLSNDIEQVDQSEKRDEGKNFESKPGEERKQTGGENCSESIKLDDLGEIDASMDIESKSQRGTISNDIEQVDQGVKVDEENNFNSKLEEEIKQTTGGNQGEEESGPVFYGTEVPGVEANRSTSLHSLGADVQNEESVWPEKARTLRNFVKEKGVVAVSTFLRAISGKVASGEEKDASDSANDGEVTKDSHKPGDRSAWNPLSYIMVSRNIDAENKAEQGVGVIAEPPEPIAMNGRVILYTKLGCQSCKEIRSFLYNRRLRYVEINVDVYPSRKRELEKFTGSCVVPKVLFNEIVIGGLSELKELDESGKLEEKIEYLITEAPSHEAPLTPLSGEDDMSSSGSVDELALIVRKMKESIVVKDRFYKMRRFPSCFLGSEAVNFLSEDQYLEREEAVEFGRKLASKLFFQHVLDENLFEDGNHLYWFMDDNPVLSSQCHNIPRGIIELKPKPIREIASRLRFLSSAICEAYVSDDGKHVDYRTIHGSEEFARYLRIIQELQRVEFQDIPREEKLAFFINLYNMMIIHSVLVFGDTDGAAERRKVLGEFKYVIGGCSYSLSAIQHGILRCNQRPPFTLTKPFRVNDKRSKVALPYLEPLIHFALVLGTRSGPALRCYSPGDIDKELMDSARNFLRGGGLVIDLNVRVVYLSKILKWFGGDFGKNEVEVLKHASNYLEPANSEALLELLASGQLKVIYQPYDWGLNL